MVHLTAALWADVWDCKWAAKMVWRWAAWMVASKAAKTVDGSVG